MPSSDYAPIVRGGLKLKGGAPTGISKKKKKSLKKEKEGASSKDEAISKALTEEDGAIVASGKGKDEDVREGEGDGEREEEGEGGGKTETERRHEEMRRKRLKDRLEKEGVKTHKQRVEELNNYLSNLSEHHDMPRIGPG